MFTETAVFSKYINLLMGVGLGSGGHEMKNCEEIFRRLQSGRRLNRGMADLWGIDIGPAIGRISQDPIELPEKKSHSQCLQEFRKLMDSRPDIDFQGDDEKFMTLFLKARKYRVGESFDLCVNYHQFRRRNQDIFDRLSALDVLVQQALRDGFPGVLSNRDRKGRTVLVFLASRWNLNCYSLLTIYRSLLLSMEYLVKDYINQERGFVVIVDWTEFSIKHSMSLNPRVLKTMIEGLQDCFPARIKAIHFVGQPWYVEAVLIVIKPFLKEKSKNKIHTHGNNLSTLHDFISRDILPPELGGEGLPLDPMLHTQSLIDEAMANLELH